MLCKKHERDFMISMIFDFDSVYQIKRSLGHPVLKDISDEEDKPKDL
jgi:hypothetical protein